MQGQRDEQCKSGLSGEAKKDTKATARIYLDCGQGLDEANPLCAEATGTQQVLVFAADIPQDCRAICFAPSDAGDCLIDDLRITVDAKRVLPQRINGLDCGGTALFFEDAPRILIAMPAGKASAHVQISCRMRTLDLSAQPDVESLIRGLGHRNLRLQAQIKAGGEELSRLQNKYAALMHDYTEAKTALNIVTNSTMWRMTAVPRRALDLFKRVVSRIPVLRTLYKGLRVLLREGPTSFMRKIKARLLLRGRYGRQVGIRSIPKAELDRQRLTVFQSGVKFSVVTPLYNTAEKFLREMIESVQAQTYGNWQLCLADGSDAAHPDVERIVREYAAKDARIVYRRLEKNMGISDNTNVCLEMADGDYIALFDHDDVLAPNALYEVMCEIERSGADFIYSDEATFQGKLDHIVLVHYKPDYAPDTLRTNNYICHLSVIKADLFRQVGGFRHEFDGSQDYDMVLRLTEKATTIRHIPKVLYYWRSHPASVASNVGAKPYAIVAAKKAIGEHLARVGLRGEVDDSRVNSMYRLRYEIDESALVSILIPNKDHVSDLEKCIDSIRQRTTYPNWEIVIVENNSTDPETFAYYSELEQDPHIRVVRWEGPFNYSAINNFGARHTSGQYLLLLNNDIEVITPEWIEEMMMFAQRADVGAVGSMLYYPDDTVQHAGVILGINGVASHAHKFFSRQEFGYMGRMVVAQNLSAVTAACMLMRKEVWDAVGGLDESFEVAFNDIDLCMRIRKAGYLIVWTPYAELYHYESKSRGLEDTQEKQNRFRGEVERFQARWKAELEAGDPYYNVNLTLTREDFSMR